VLVVASYELGAIGAFRQFVGLRRAKYGWRERGDCRNAPSFQGHGRILAVRAGNGLVELGAMAVRTVMNCAAFQAEENPHQKIT